MNVIQLHQVSRARGTGRHAVQALVDVDLTVRAGELLLVEGPSGSGKTTLLSVSAGLLAPHRGVVVLAGKRLCELDSAHMRAHRARAVGFVFQRANLLEGLSVRENVLVGAAIAGIERGLAARAADRLLGALGIAQLGARRPSELSGGEEQRAAVARALVHRPAALFADEPTANLWGPTSQKISSVNLPGGRNRAFMVPMRHDVSRFPYMVRPCMRGVSDRARVAACSHSARRDVAFRGGPSASAP